MYAMYEVKKMKTNNSCSQVQCRQLRNNRITLQDVRSILMSLMTQDINSALTYNSLIRSKNPVGKIPKSQAEPQIPPRFWGNGKEWQRGIGGHTTKPLSEDDQAIHHLSLARSDNIKSNFQQRFLPRRKIFFKKYIHV